MNYHVIGAGLSGLIAGALLRSQCKAIFERQPNLPNNHHALLRFRSSVIGDNLGIDFSKVRVIKSIVSEISNPVGQSISYSVKTNGMATLRSVVTADNAPVDRYIAPYDLVNKLYEMQKEKVFLGRVDGLSLIGGDGYGNAIRISTIPMPTLMKELGYQSNIKFHSVRGFTIKVDLNDCDVCATIYFPDKKEDYYRASIVKDKLIIEFAAKKNETDDQFFARFEKIEDHPSDQYKIIDYVLSQFGMQAIHIRGKPEVKSQLYSKILPIDDIERKRFIHWATDNHNIFSLGRFATWRPSLLLDDLVNDVNVIKRLAKHDAVRYDQLTKN